MGIIVASHTCTFTALSSHPVELPAYISQRRNLRKKWRPDAMNGATAYSGLQHRLRDEPWPIYSNFSIHFRTGINLLLQLHIQWFLYSVWSTAQTVAETRKPQKLNEGTKAHAMPESLTTKHWASVQVSKKATQINWIFIQPDIFSVEKLVS